MLSFVFASDSNLQVRKRGRAESSAQGEAKFYRHSIDVILRDFTQEVNLEFSVLDFAHEVEIHEELSTLDYQIVAFTPAKTTHVRYLKLHLEIVLVVNKRIIMIIFNVG